MIKTELSEKELRLQITRYQESIRVLEWDIKSLEATINQDRKTIATYRFFIQSAEDAIKIIGKEEEDAQENHAEGGKSSW